MRSVSVLSLSMLLALACGGADGEGATVSDSSGIRIVTSRQPAWGDQPEWRVDSQPELWLGDPTTANAVLLVGINGVRELSDGRLVAVTGSDRRIRWFTPDGQQAGEAGGAGDSIGQFRTITLLGVLGDSLFVWDHQRDRGTVYSPTGTLVRTFTLSWGDAPTTPRYGFVPVALFANGELLVSGRTGAASAEAGGYRRDTIPLARATAVGIVGAPFVAVAGNESVIASGPGFVSVLPRPFGSQTSVATVGNDALISVGDHEDLVRFGPSGALESIGRLVRPRRAIPPEDLERHGRRRGSQMAELPEEMSNAVGAAMVSAGVPAALPFYDRLVVDVTGAIWLREDVGPERANVVDQRWFILDETGRWLGTVVTPRRFTMHQVTRDRIIGVWQDDDDVEYVRVYRLRR